MTPTAIDPKMRRGRISCDLCRRMKIRCDKQGNEQCSNCRPRNVTCVITPVERKATKVKRAEFLHSIESRIERMEALLESNASGSSTNPTATSSSSTVDAAARPDLNRDASTASLEKEVSNLIINETGEQKYIGPSSGFSLLSPRGMAWIQRKTGSKRIISVMQKFRSAGPIWPSHRIGHQWDGGSIVRSELPTREAAVHIVNHYFNFFNASLPLFDRRTFWALFEQQGSSHPPTKRSWFGALNVALLIGCITATESVYDTLRAIDPVYFADRSEVVWRFFQNASSVFLDILFLDTDLMGVQTVIGMAFYMQSIMNPDGAFVLLGVACRVSASLGLHQWLEGFGMHRAELEQRQRVFWIMYVLEKDMALRIGRPSSLDDRDIRFVYPSEMSPADDETSISCPSNDNKKFYPFQTLCTLARIESKVYTELYITQARKKTATERLQSISALDAELQEWKENIPIELRPENPIQCEADARFSIVMLHFRYYSCLAAIHRVHAHHEMWASENADFESSQSSASPESATSPDSVTNPRAHTSYALCLAAARSVLHLSIAYLGDRKDPRNSLIWIAPYFPVSAFLVLFSHMLYSPLEEGVARDDALMQRMAGILSKTLNVQDKSFTFFVADLVGELYSIGHVHVKNAQAQSRSQSFPAPVTWERFSPQGNDTAAAAAAGTTASRDSSLPTPQPPTYVDPSMTNMGPASLFASPQPLNPILTANLDPSPAFLSFPGILPTTTATPGFSTGETPGQDFVPDFSQFAAQDTLMDDPFFLLQDADWNWNY